MPIRNDLIGFFILNLKGSVISWLPDEPVRNTTQGRNAKVLFGKIVITQQLLSQDRICNAVCCMST